LTTKHLLSLALPQGHAQTALSQSFSTSARPFAGDVIFRGK